MSVSNSFERMFYTGIVTDLITLIPNGGFPFFWAGDTLELYVWDGLAGWQLVGGGGGALPNHDHSGDPLDGGTFDAANLTSDAAGAGDVLTADGIGGASWVPVGGLVLALDDLTDVNAPAPNNQDVLTWDAGSGMWIAQAGGCFVCTPDNTYGGQGALVSLTIGTLNTAVGVNAGTSITLGESNSILGNNALAGDILGGYNTVIGESAMLANSGGNDNVGIGVLALGSNEGDENVGVGSGAGNSLLTGHGNTFIGRLAGWNASQKTDAESSIAIGINAYTTKDYQVVLGDDSIVETLLKGTVIINEIGAAGWDFRVETDVYDALFVDASNDSIEIMSNPLGKVGYFGVAAVAQSTGWAMSNVTPDKILDADATTLSEVADVLGTLIDILKLNGTLGA